MPGTPSAIEKILKQKEIYVICPGYYKNNCDNPVEPHLENPDLVVKSPDA